MTDQPAACTPACSEQHTYTAGCAAITDTYDHAAGMRERYAEALYQAAEDRAFAPYLDREQCAELADAVLAARDIHLTNVGRMWREQHTELIEAFKTKRDRAEMFERAAGRLQRRIDAARDWGRRNLPAEQQTALLEVLRGDGDQPKEKP